MTPFSARAGAEARKGGADKLAAPLPEKPDREALRRLPDDRALAEMTKRVFSAGFSEETGLPYSTRPASAPVRSGRT